METPQVRNAANEESNGGIGHVRAVNRTQLEENFYLRYDPSQIKTRIKADDHEHIGGGAHFEVYLFSGLDIVAKRTTTSAPASADWYFRCLEHIEQAGITLFPPVAILRVENRDWLITPYFSSHGFLAKSELGKWADLEQELKRIREFGYTVDDRLHCGEFAGSKFVIDWSDLKDYRQ